IPLERARPQGRASCHDRIRSQARGLTFGARAARALADSATRSRRPLCGPECDPGCRMTRLPSDDFRTAHSSSSILVAQHASHAKTVGQRRARDRARETDCEIVETGDAASRNYEAKPNEDRGNDESDQRKEIANLHRYGILLS